MTIDVNVIWMLFSATALILLLYLPGITKGIDLADEGYLWFGTQQVLAGRVPIRDFRAYDPGRYYWFAAWMLLLGNRLLSIRIAALVTQILVLTAAQYTVYIVTAAWLPTLLTGLAIALWMQPHHKQLDMLFSVATPLMGVLLADHPTAIGHAAAGVYVMACLFFGLNHALYAGTGLVLLMLVTQAIGVDTGPGGAWLAFASGLLAGGLPLLAYALLIPGFRQVYWAQKVVRILRRGTANLPLGVPWLWRAAPPQLARFCPQGQRMVRGLFTLMPLAYVLVVAYGVLQSSSNDREDLLILALACSGLPYLHHAYSRADYRHLAQSVAPFLMLMTVLLARHPVGIILLGVFVGFCAHYLFKPETLWPQALLGKEGLSRFRADGTDWWLRPRHEQYLTRVRELVEKHTGEGDAVLLLPILVTLYPLLRRRPAVYDVFCVYPASAEEERIMLRQIRDSRCRFALINDAAIDAREALRFRHTHPAVWAHLESEFSVTRLDGVLSNHYLFLPKDLVQEV